MTRSLRTMLAATAIGGLTLTGCSQSASDVPAFDDIEPAMWDAMSDSAAMSMTGVLPEAMASDAALIENVLGGSLADVEIYGSLTEPATGIRLGEDQDPFMMFIDDEVFVSMGMTLEAMAASPVADPEEAELAAQLATELEGKYRDVTADYGAVTVDVADLLADMRAAVEAGQTDEVTGLAFHELQQEGSYMQLNMETEDTGWFYHVDGSDDQAVMNGEATKFLGMNSDHEAPRLDRIVVDDTRIDFSWDDSVEIPQRPTEDQLIDEEDLTDLLTQ